MATEIILIAIGAVLSLIGGLIAVSLQWVASSVNGLRDEVTVLNCTVGALKTDLDFIKQNYVTKAEHMEIKTAFWALHDEHLKTAPTCGTKPKVKK